MVKQDLRALQCAEAGWKKERERLTAIAEDKRTLIGDAVLEALGLSGGSSSNKRARAELTTAAAAASHYHYYGDDGA